MPRERLHLDRVILLALLALFLLVSPVKELWTAPSAPWYTPYLIWLAIILLARRLVPREPS